MSDDAPRGNPGVDPDDLDISESEYVRELGEDRYVVSAGSRPPRVGDRAGDADGDPDGDAAPEARQDPRTEDPRSEDAPDAASLAEAAREGLAPDEGPGAAAVDDGVADADAAAGPPAADTDTHAETDTGVRSGGGTADASARTDETAPGAARPADAGLPDAGSSDAGSSDTGSSDAGTARDRSTARDRPASHERRGAPRREDAGATDAGTADPAALDAGAVGQWLAASLADSEFAYGFDATLSLNGRTARHRMASDDVGETFETLVTWFAGAAGGDTPTEDALGILLAGMDNGPRVPPNAVRSALGRLGLSRDDSMEDLLEALEREGGLRL
ncbi:hypothetical protein Hbl1158_01315 [Halobaculum sp. CBA1158]|uniref:DUF7500 family protein n=1 Tax=Halobaculum sp. CBA1158 TaxID=2904243 RepID=UPI001F1DCD26|nr:hypothetical protein [Halobaculum sp. CBA1158]UIP00039.1 hypothetical protein Hbl1158_01315 [Halobaculum sp. CBA1158]